MTLPNSFSSNRVKMALLVTVFNADFNGVIGFKVWVKDLALVAPPITITSVNAKTYYHDLVLT